MLWSIPGIPGIPGVARVPRIARRRRRRRWRRHEVPGEERQITLADESRKPITMWAHGTQHDNGQIETGRCSGITAPGISVDGVFWEDAITNLARRSSKRQKSLTGTWLEALAGQLADPTDLEFDEDHLDDPDALAAAVDDLLARKPHLASRRADR
jgi:hypothetical protein